MVTIESQFFVARIGGREITDFLLDCTDDRYRQWWPGTHLALHAVSRVFAIEHGCGYPR